MKFLKVALFAAVLALSTMGVDRVQWLTSIQPTSNWMNTSEVNKTVDIGQLIWDIVGRANAGGFVTNLTIVPDGGNMYVDVNPAVANTYGSIYQVNSIDLTPFGDSSGQIPANANQVFHQYLFKTGTGALGPMTSPTGSFSVIDLVECHGVTNDINSSLQNFVSSSDVISQRTVPRDRADYGACQIKAGTPAVSPVVPTTDAGWVAIGQVTIPANTTAITSGMIQVYSQFGGFATATGNYVDTTTNGQNINATKQANANWTYAGAGILFNGAPTISTSTPGVFADGQTNLGLIINTASSSLGTQFATNGTLNGAAITAAGFKMGSSTLGSTSLNLNGASLTSTALQAASGSNLNLESNGSSSGAGVTINKGAGSGTNNGGLLIYDGGSSNFSQLTWQQLTIGSSSVTSSSIASGGGFSGATLPVGQCLTVDSGHNIIGTGSACGSGSGSITSVSGSGNVTASTVSGAVTVGMVNSPVFATASTAGCILLGSDSADSLCRSASNWTLAGSSTNPTLTSTAGFVTGSSSWNSSQLLLASVAELLNTNTATSGTNYGSYTQEFVTSVWNGSSAVQHFWKQSADPANGMEFSYDSGAPIFELSTTGALTLGGSVTATSFSGSASGLTSVPANQFAAASFTSGRCVRSTSATVVASAAGDCVTSVTASGNLSSSGGTTPAITLTASPSFTAVGLDGNAAPSNGIACGVANTTSCLFTATTGTATTTGFTYNSTTACNATTDTFVLWEVNSVSIAHFTCAGGLAVNGYVDAGLSTPVGLGTGDVAAAETSHTGKLFLGGLTNSCILDYNITSVNTDTFACNAQSTGSIIAGEATAATTTSGDMAASETTSKGAILLGGSSSSCKIDYGVTTSSVATVGCSMAVSSVKITGLASSTVTMLCGSNSANVSQCSASPLLATSGNTNVATGTTANTYQQLGATQSITTGVSNGTNGEWLVEVHEHLVIGSAVSGGIYGCVSSASTYTVNEGTTDGPNTCLTTQANSFAGSPTFGASTGSNLGLAQDITASVLVANSTTFNTKCWAAGGGSTSTTVYGYCRVEAFQY